MSQTSTNIQYNIVFVDRKSNLTTSNLNNGDVAFCSEDKSITLKYNDQLITMCPPTQQASIPDASTSQKGIVQLTSSINTDSTSLAATASAVKAAYDRGSTGITDAAAAKTRADSAYTEATTNATSSTAGRVKLLDSYTSTATDSAATSKAVKAAYDRGSTGITNAATAQSKADSAYNLANTANSKIPSGTIVTTSNIGSYALTSSNYTNYISNSGGGVKYWKTSGSYKTVSAGGTADWDVAKYGSPFMIMTLASTYGGHLEWFYGKTLCGCRNVGTSNVSVGPVLNTFYNASDDA